MKQRIRSFRRGGDGRCLRFTYANACLLAAAVANHLFRFALLRFHVLLIGVLRDD